MVDSSQDRLADVVNAEPIVFMDCTGNEILVSGMVAFALGMVVGIVIGLVMGMFLIGCVLGLMFSLGLSYGFLQYLCAVRSKYYETWLEEKWFMAKLHSGFFGLSLIEDSVRYGRGARTRE